MSFKGGIIRFLKKFLAKYKRLTNLLIEKISFFVNFALIYNYTTQILRIVSIKL